MSDLREMKRLGYTCFCGGDGKYTDYNCNAEFLVTCPHCNGTGHKLCTCTKVSLRCPK